jgi:DNA polymerase
MPPAAVVEEILGHVRDGALDWINLAYGPPMECISRCSRSFFIAPDGKLLLTADFSAVEGRGTAWVAGEEWKLAAFRAVDAKTGPGIYEVTASKTLGIPVEEIGPDSIERQIGKVQELLLGYGGGVGALRRGLPPRLKDTPDKTLNKWKLAWRAAHPRIVAFWHDVELAAVSAVHEEGKIFTAGAGKRGVQFKKAGSFLWCRLPSGRVMCYPYPKLLPGEYGTQLTYMTVPGEADIPKIIKDVKNANNWARIATYGGALTENIVQAICRDLLAEAMLTLDAEGFCIVLHVHDEVVCEVQENVAGYERKIMEGIMRTPPVWAPDFPQWSSVKQMKRYGKG